jgi:eukaryotic-like serine/threonine-protein kinase
MATVYLAHDLKHRRPVALKVLHPELAATVGPARFLREIEVTAGLDHPHILPMLDSGDAGGLVWYTMPYVEGESLRDRLRRELQLPLDEAVRITCEIADGLEYAHRHRVVHRDIKPENILLAHGHARVADFGVAQALESAGGDRLTGTGLAIGTPLYMSPEQCGGGELDGRSDLYSLGCVLYEMLAGEPPFSGRTPQAIIAKRLSDAAPTVRRIRPTVPPHLDSALTKALAPVPADRFATIGGFAHALVSGQPVSQARHLPVPAVLALYVLVTLAVLLVAYLLTNALGLPNWVPRGALVLSAAGLPIILVTAGLQRRALRATTEGRRQQSSPAPWLTWRRALSGGALAFAALGMVTVGFMALRALGIGAVGSLLGAGVFKERERLVLADFQNATPDSLLSNAVTTAFRIDFAQSPVVTLVPATRIAEVLTRMKRAATARFDPMLAREVAVREGIKGVVSGEIAKVGAQYVLSVQLVSAGDGEVLAARRETASDSTELIAAIDQLSKRLRERIGESLRTIRRNPPLSRVTTGSLEALRKYAQATHAGNVAGDLERAISLLEAAVAIDSGFAMAYGAMGQFLLNSGAGWDRYAEQIRRGHAHLDRLTERERYLMLGDYYTGITYELEKAVAAYRSVLETYPDDLEALNNLGLVYRNAGDFVRAEPLFERAVATDSLPWQPSWNLVWIRVGLGKRREAEATYERLANRFPDIPLVLWLGALLASSGGDYAGAEIRARALVERQGMNPHWRAEGSRQIAHLALLRGMLVEGERHLRQALKADIEAGSPAARLDGAVSLASLNVRFRGEAARGLVEVDTALARYPLDSLKPLDRPYVSLAAIYAAAGKPEKARTLLTQYEQVVKPEERREAEPERHNAWGEVAMAEGRFQDAIDEFRKQRGTSGCHEPGELAVGTTCGLADLGRAYDRLGQPDSAIANYERYSTMPDLFRVYNDARELAGSYQRLGELYEARQDREKARQYYSRFMDLWKNCDPELRPAVTEVRRRLAGLAGD